MFKIAQDLFMHFARFDPWNLTGFGSKACCQQPPGVRATSYEKSDMDAVFSSIGLSGIYDKMDLAALFGQHFVRAKILKAMKFPIVTKQNLTEASAL